MAKKSNPIECSRCGQEIYFDYGKPRSQSGKMIPYEYQGGYTDDKHDCPQSDYYKKERAPDYAPSTKTQVNPDRIRVVSTNPAAGEGLVQMLQRIESKIDTLLMHYGESADAAAEAQFDQDKEQGLV